MTLDEASIAGSKDEISGERSTAPGKGSHGRSEVPAVETEAASSSPGTSDGRREAVKTQNPEMALTAGKEVIPEEETPALKETKNVNSQKPEENPVIEEEATQGTDRGNGGTKTDQEELHTRASTSAQSSNGEPETRVTGVATEVNSKKAKVGRESQNLESDEQASAPEKVKELENPEVTSSQDQGQRKAIVHYDGKEKVKGNQNTPSTSSDTERRSDSHKITKPRGASKRGRGWQATKKVSRK
jgi:hypothetical protein